MYVVSACLCGFPCRYDGTPSCSDKVDYLLKSGHAVPVCPEVLGGLPVPRDPCEIAGGGGNQVLAGTTRVINIKGRDVTGAYVDGAWKALYIALQTGCNRAILKARSPACGRGRIYDGTFTGTIVTGDGVLAALLKEHDIAVYTEECIPAHPNGTLRIREYPLLRPPPSE